MAVQRWPCRSRGMVKTTSLPSFNSAASSAWAPSSACRCRSLPAQTARPRQRAAAAPAGRTAAVAVQRRHRRCREARRSLVCTSAGACTQTRHTMAQQHNMGNCERISIGRKRFATSHGMHLANYFLTGLHSGMVRGQMCQSPVDCQSAHPNCCHGCKRLLMKLLPGSPLAGRVGGCPA